MYYINNPQSCQKIIFKAIIYTSINQLENKLINYTMLTTAADSHMTHIPIFYRCSSIQTYQASNGYCLPKQFIYSYAPAILIMTTRKSHANFQSQLTEPPKIQTLKKIKPSDHFPCFACFDNPSDKIGCQECNGKGWVSGSHPMVQFAEDFIEKRLSGFVTHDMGNSSAGHSDLGDVFARMSGSYDPQKKQKQVMPGKSAKTVTFSEEIRQSKRQQFEEPIQQQFFCDQCQGQEPIKGTRYHCQICPDFDLCAPCYSKARHTHQDFKQFAALKKPDNETLLAQLKQTQIRKSLRGSK